MHDEFTAELTRRTTTALLLAATVFFFSTFAYYATGCVVGMNARYQKSLFDPGDDQWELTECGYAAAMAVTTVGFTDVLGTERVEVWQDADGTNRWVSNTDAHEEPGFDEATAHLAWDFSAFTRSVTGLVVVLGMGIYLYVVAQLTSFFVEGGYGELNRMLRARRLAARQKDHVIVVGAGGLALHAIRRMQHDEVPCVVISSSKEDIRRLHGAFPKVACIFGEGAREESLESAGIERARGMLITLGDDSMNLVGVVTGRQLRRDLRIVTRAESHVNADRLRRAGAATVVSDDLLIGLRSASELIRPSVVYFLDILMGRVHDAPDIQLEGVIIGPEAAGYPVSMLDLRRNAGLELVALRRADSDVFVYNPWRGEVLEEGDTLAALGPRESLAKLRTLLAAPPIARPDMDSIDSGEHLMDVTMAFSKPNAPSTSELERLEDHYIVCGAGRIGMQVIRELSRTGRHIAAIERRHDRIERMRSEFPGVLLVEGDPDHPEVLRKAGVERARGLATTFASDTSNLVVVVTALQAKPGLRIVSLVSDDRETRRLIRAGATVVSGGRICGNRSATELIRPTVTGFLDLMLSSPGAARFESVVVRPDAPAAGKTLSDANLYAETGLRVLALRKPGERFRPNPTGTDVLEPGSLLVVVGTSDEVQGLVDLVGDWE